MKLVNIYKDLKQERYKNIEVKGLSLDSRKVIPGDVFIALNGIKTSGLDYIDEAIERGAVAVFFEGGEEKELENDEYKIPVISVPDLKKQTSGFANKFYQSPSESMEIVGITGTNGKTSCAYFISSMQAALGRKSAVIGTLGVTSFFDESQGVIDTGYTTPDAIASQKHLHKLKTNGCTHAALEVSSHALDQFRVADIKIKTALITNLTRDHLDYHKTYDEYKNAKKSLFEFASVKRIVINIDDKFGRELYELNNAKERSLQKECVTYSLKSEEADVYAKNITMSLSGIKADITAFDETQKVFVSLLGEFNLSNLLAAIAVLLKEYGLKDIVSVLSNIQLPAGRMQIVTLSEYPIQNDILVVVDFAHTPDALENLLKSIKAHTDYASNRISCIFGCGGDRDKGKRSEMGAVAERESAKVFLTNDNPRSEDPLSIVEQIKSGIKNLSKVTVELDRAKAISEAVLQASEGEIIVIAGKGHEKYQLIAGKKYEFDDYQVAQKALEQRYAA